MKSNLAILSSDKKSIELINQLDLKNRCHLYANCSRNVEIAQNFSKENGFKKYYGSYEELINDKEVDIVLNLLPSGIKFEYTYLCLKKGLRVICDYPIIKSSTEIPSYWELINNNLTQNLMMIDNQDIKKFFEISKNKKKLFYFKIKKKDSNKNNSLSTSDIFYEMTPDLFFYLDKLNQKNIKVNVLNIFRDKITNNINHLNCNIIIDSNIYLQVLLDNGSDDNFGFNFDINKFNEINAFINNREDLENFVIGKKPFDNLSEFQYYPFKLFQEVFNE